MRHVLVVEDEESNRSLLGVVLENAGHQVILVANGRDAIEATPTNLDVAFIDMHLPDMKGIDVVRKLRETYTNTFIVSATMDDNPNMIANAYRAGCDMFLVKPYNVGQLVTLVSEAQRGKLWIVDRLGKREYHGPR